MECFRRSNFILFGTLSTFLYALLIGYLNYRQYCHIALLEKRKIVSSYEMFHSICSLDMDQTNEHLFPECPILVKAQIMSYQYDKRALIVGASLQAFETITKIGWFGTPLFTFVWKYLSTRFSLLCQLECRWSTITTVETLFYFLALYQVGLAVGHLVALYYKKNILQPRYFALKDCIKFVQLKDLLSLRIFKDAFSYSLFITLVVLLVQNADWNVIYGISLILKYMAGQAGHLVFLESCRAVPISSVAYIERTLKLMLQSEKYSLEDVYIIEENKDNALIMGSFGDYMMLIYKGLWDALNMDEFKAIVAHEIAHWALSHGNISLIFSSLANYTRWILFCHFISCTPDVGPFQVVPSSRTHSRDNGKKIKVGIFAFLLLHFLFDWTSLPYNFITNWTSQQQEYDADVYAATNFPFGPFLIAALSKIVSKDSIDPIVNAIFSTHPLLDQRIRNILEKISLINS